MRRSGGAYRLAVAALVLLVVLPSLLVGVRTAWVGYGPPPDARTAAAQVRWLSGALADGADRRMQDLFPEGSFFTIVLTALAEARQPETEVQQLRQRLAALDSPEITQGFGHGLTPQHGIFHAGWTLLLAAEIARRSGATSDLALLRHRADVVSRALADHPAGFPASYPGQRWPCDAVVAAAAVARANQLEPNPIWRSRLQRWRSSARAAEDPALGLLPHRVDERGRSLEGPRGSSQAIIQVFWPDVTLALDPEPDLASWRRYTLAFVERRVGLVGVREYPRGTSGPADIDSGPLVLGISASASAVTLAAARRAGDTGLAESLDREAELLGSGLTLDGRRRYAFGVLPVGDAFLAWARTWDAGTPAPNGDTPRPSWPLGIAAALLPGALAVALVAWARRRTGPIRAAG